MDSLGNTAVQAPRARHTTFSDLPDEVLAQVFLLMTPADLKDLRLVCRRWNATALDKRTWQAVFHNRLGTGATFASVSRLARWLPEYFARVALLRRWAKAKAAARLYPFVASDAGLVSAVLTDFANDRLLTYSRLLGTVALCTLSTGKNQVFIPQSVELTDAQAYDVTWSHLCVGTARGGVYVKNLMVASLAALRRLSTQRLPYSGVPQAVRLNKSASKAGQDVAVVSADGQLTVWSLGLVLLATVDLRVPVVAMECDFATAAVVLTPTSVLVVDWASKTVQWELPHGLNLEEHPAAFAVDFQDNNVLLAHGAEVHVLRWGLPWAVASCTTPEGLHVIRGTLQDLHVPRNTDLAGDDGRLWALTLADGSVAVYNVRLLGDTVDLKCHILPFRDDRTPQGLAQYTAVALSEAVVGIGVLADYIHFYDAHTGKYLREGTKVSRKLTRHGPMAILKLVIGPGASGLVVSDDVTQYFSFGSDPVLAKKPNTPVVPEHNRKEASQIIRTQMDDYEWQEHVEQQNQKLADKYNGTRYDSEQDEYRMALALSASASESRVEVVPDDDNDAELQEALLRSEHETTGWVDAPTEGLSQREESEDDVMRRVLALSKVEH